MKKYSLLLMAFASLCLFTLNSCGGGTNADGIKLDEQGREDFLEFRHKFYHEIDFQLSRIEFPVLGPTQVDGRPKFIEEQDWDVLRPIDPENKDIETHLHYSAEDLVEEIIVVKRAFVIKLRFNLNELTNQWYLSYYSGVNASKSKPESNPTVIDSTETAPDDSEPSESE